MIAVVASALLKLTLPVAVLTFFLLRRLVQRGYIELSTDQKALWKDLKAHHKTGVDRTNLLQSKWMQMGGGFYGTAALWTWLYIEAEQLVAFLSDLPSLEQLFSEGLIGLLVGLLLNQISVFVEAIVWFKYWGGANQFIVVWLAAGYAGYWIGLQACRRMVHQST